jgi:hypothetical protein
MFEQLVELIGANGIWCGLCVFLIYRQNKRFEALQDWVQSEVIVALNASTKVMTDIKEKLDAHKNDR